MKNVIKHYSLLIFLTIGFVVIPIIIKAQNTQSPQDKLIITNFENQIKDYSKLREKVETGVPALPKKATAEQIEAHKLSFQKGVQAARSGARQGEIFTPAAAELIKRIIKSEFQGSEKNDLRRKVFEAELKGVPVKVNVVYPDSKEQIEMPPTLLLKLPQLPKELRYRFVGSNFIIVDKENGLIIDFMTNALP